MPEPPPEEPDWIDRLAGLAGKLGFSEVQVRWKLMRFQEWAGSLRERSRQTAAHVGYEHRVCAHCGRINDREYAVCTGCSRPLSSRTWEILSRLGVVSPLGSLVSTLLGLAMLVAYGAVVQRDPNGWLNPDPRLLLALGANYPDLVFAGEYWRLVTSIFLHGGLAHLGFNMVALTQIGPAIEEAFGPARMAFLFMLTGILAALGSAWMRADLGGVGIGASGAICGLIGVAAGWGQREGTITGRLVRDQMVQWGFYTLLFGYGMGADNTAHAVGLATGALLGWGMHPDWLRRGTTQRLEPWLALLAGGLALAAVLRILTL